MKFTSDRQRKAIFASFKNRFSREGLPGLGDALVGSIVGLWPGNGNEIGRSDSVSLNDSESVSVESMGAERFIDTGFHQVPTADILRKPLNEQFKLAIEDKIGESELYKNMAHKVSPEDAAQLNYMAEQQEWNKDNLTEMSPRYVGTVSEVSGLDADVLQEDVSEKALIDYGKDFSNEPTEDDYLASEVFDIDPDVMSDRSQMKREGKNVSPFVPRDKFIDDFRELVGNVDSADELYDIYLSSESKNHIDYIKRLGVPTDEDMVFDSNIPSSYIRDEVYGVIPESQMKKVKDIVDTYEVDGGYVFIGSVNDVVKAKDYVR